MRAHLEGFVEFIRSKGVVGLAIGIIIGVSVTGLVQSLVDDIVNPLVGLMLDADSLELATASIGGATIGWGNFVARLFDLTIVAAVVYFGVRLVGLDKIDSQPEA